MSSRINKLDNLCEDKDDKRKTVQALSCTNEFTEFYNRVKQIKEFYPDEISIPLSIGSEETTRVYLNTDSLVEFTDEEGCC
uniref:Splicing factor SF3a60 binding domain-containing protein n=1 Tax=Megaselia scalaris TaxID=36166 RepID=T1H4F2_MEGSC